MTRLGLTRTQRFARGLRVWPGRLAAYAIRVVVLLAVAACGTMPGYLAGPVEPPIVLSPAPAVVAAGALAPSAAVPVAVLRDSAVAKAEANRYVAWEGSSPANIRTLAGLTARVTQSVRDMRRSLAHGRYGARQVQAARAATDALHVFLQNKGD